MYVCCHCLFHLLGGSGNHNSQLNYRLLNYYQILNIFFSFKKDRSYSWRFLKYFYYFRTAKRGVCGRVVRAVDFESPQWVQNHTRDFGIFYVTISESYQTSLPKLVVLQHVLKARFHFWPEESEVFLTQFLTVLLELIYVILFQVTCCNGNTDAPCCNAAINSSNTDTKCPCSTCLEKFKPRIHDAFSITGGIGLFFSFTEVSTALWYVWNNKLID